MKTGGPSPSPNVAPVRRIPTGPKEPSIDLTRNESSTTLFNTNREQPDRQRRAEPEFQDGSYGFEAKEDEMEVDTDTMGANNTAPDPRPELSRPRNDRQENRDRDRRDDRRDARYDAPRDGGRGRPFYDRDRNSGRARNDYRLHSDDIYPRPRGRGFR